MKYSRKNKRVKKTRSKTHKRYMRGGFYNPRSPSRSPSRYPSNPRSAKAKNKILNSPNKDLKVFQVKNTTNK